MTTLVGIVAEKGKKSVILASDLNRTHVNWQPQGDYAFKKLTKTEAPKIWVNDQRDLALCMTGVFDQYYIEFLARVLNGKIDFKKALKKGVFEQLKNINYARWQGKMPTENFNALLVATRYKGEPRLYTCFPLGNVEERDCASIGSGSDFAFAYLQNQDIMSSLRITRLDAIDLATGALEAAAQDIYTGGLDIVSVGEKGIKEFRPLIQRIAKQDRLRLIEAIKHR